MMFGLLLFACSSERRLSDRTTSPLRPANEAEVVARFEFPPMHVTVSRDGRIFLDALARDRSSAIKTVELKAGVMTPFPIPELQHKFSTIHGVHVDRKDRLWVLDHGNYAASHRPRIYGYDIATGKEIEDYAFPAAVAPLGSMLNDLVVEDRHEKALISDTGSLFRDSAIVEFDIAHRNSRRMLPGHPSLRQGQFDIVVENQPFRIMRIFRPRYGIDGIALDPAGRWFYYSALNSGELYRVPVSAAFDESIDNPRLATQVEKVADITMTDGMLFDSAGRLYLSDIEHSAIVRLTPAGQLETVFKDPRFRWPISYALAPDGQIYFTCGSIDRVQLRNRTEIMALGPYFLYRFRPDS